MSASPSDGAVETLDDPTSPQVVEVVLASGWVAMVAIEEFNDGDRGVAARIAGAYARGLTEGDERVENAVAVSLVEDTPQWSPARTAFIESWPEPLRVEAERQRDRHA